MNNQKLLLIDGNSILNRAYFALPPLTDTQGNNVNAVYGFTNILLKVVGDYKPDKLVVAFDKRGENFRKKLYPEYKATRKGMPDDLASQMPILQELLKLMNITVVQKAGIEADDIIGTISNHFDGYSYIVSGDKDMLQLVSPTATVLLTKRGVTEVDTVDMENLKQNYGLTPAQVVEFKALRGDTSDNIPGVRGIGDKTAMQLLAKYGDIDNLYANIENEKGALREKLETGKRMAYVSRKLATIVTNADIDYDICNCGLYTLDIKVKQRMEQLQFKSIANRLHFEEDSRFQEVDVQTVIVETCQQLQQVVEDMKQGMFAFYLNDDIVYISNSNKLQYEIRISDNFLDEMTAENFCRIIQPLLVSDAPKAVYDSKALRHKLDLLNLTITNIKYDVCLMQYLLEYRAYKDVQSLCVANGYEQLGAGIYAIAGTLLHRIEQIGIDHLYFDVELPLSYLLYQMEVEGVKVDLQLLDKMSAEMHQQLDGIIENIYALAGENFNLNSPMQLQRVLFDKLQLPKGKKTQRGYSTDNDVLESLLDKHPIAQLLLDYRKVSKLLSTYIDGLKPLVKKGLVHTTYNQTLTSTGRLSSSDPNLQNIPIRDDIGKEIRKLFCSKHGVFVGADYSQIELRLVAAFSHDVNLLRYYREGKDVHTMVASEILGIPPEMVNADMRRMAKAVNFGIIYGISAHGLSQNIKISQAKAKEYIDLYFKRFPKIKGYLEDCVDEAKSLGYVTTITGRRRQIPELSSSNYNVRMFGERAAMNMPLQGSAADIMKIAMLKVDSAMKQAGLKSKIVLQIHDELIVDCFIEEKEQVKAILKEQMESAVTILCPLVAQTEEGVNLYEA